MLRRLPDEAFYKADACGAAGIWLACLYVVKEICDGAQPGTEIASGCS